MKIVSCSLALAMAAIVPGAEKFLPMVQLMPRQQIRWCRARVSRPSQLSR